MPNDSGILLSAEEIADSYTVLVQFGNTVATLIYCSAPRHVLNLDVHQIVPIGRAFGDYAWYAKASQDRVYFDSERAAWIDFIEGIAVSEFPPRLGERFLFRDFECIVVEPPRHTEYGRPPAV